LLRRYCGLFRAWLSGLLLILRVAFAALAATAAAASTAAAFFLALSLRR
jgi:hypothetical protein